MERRLFLKQMGALGFSFFGASPLSIAKNLEEKNNLPIFIFLFLRGGADGLSMLTPYSDKNYFEKRPKIAIPKNKGLILNADFSVNPILKETYYRYYKENKAVFIPSGGQKDNSRSHFFAEEVLQHGNSKDKSGFLNRLSEIKNLNGVSFTSSLYPIFKGTKPIPSFSLDELSFHSSKEEEQIISELYRKDKNLNQTLNVLYSNKPILEEIKKESSKDYDEVGRFMRFAKFMEISNSNLGFVLIDGWDTHIGQGLINSQFTKLLEKLNKSLLSYEKASSKDYWDRTYFVIFSEFGRTLAENGGLGTEHGHGNLISILGGGVKKSKILGNWDGLSKLHEDRDLFVHHEFNSILARLFKDLYQLSEKELNYVFPGTKKEKINLI